MSESNPLPPTSVERASPFPRIGTVALAAPARWIRAGINDLMRAPLPS